MARITLKYLSQGTYKESKDGSQLTPLLGRTSQLLSQHLTRDTALLNIMYSEFYRLNQELHSTFPNLKFPPFPKKIIFSRSQVRNVADKRMVELQTYLQGILSYPEITAGSCLCEFLRQTVDHKEMKYSVKDFLQAA